MMYLHLVIILSLVHCGTRALGQKQDVSGCGGSIKCPVGAACDDVILPAQESGSSTTESGSQGRRCTDNALCIDSKCTCAPGFLATSYGFCLPSFNTSCAEWQCNEEADLICSEEDRCVCPLRETHFSAKQGACVGDVGSSCSGSYGCADNGFCNFLFDWKCHCNGGFSVTADGTCQAALNAPCSDNNSCNPDHFLRCLNRKCVCDEGRLLDTTQERCLSLVGGKCDLKVTADMTRISTCVKGATCNPSADLTDTRSGTCVCSDGGQKAADGMCHSLATYPQMSILLILLPLLIST